MVLFDRTLSNRTEIQGYHPFTEHWPIMPRHTP